MEPADPTEEQQPQQNDWSKEAENYAKHAMGFTNLFGQVAVEEAVQARLKKGSFPKDTIRYLDTAAGTGAATFSTLDAICKDDPNRSVLAIATDLSKDMLAMMDRQTESRGIAEKYPNVTIETRIANMEDLSCVPDCSQDIISCIFGILFCPQPVKVLKEINRVLAPGGVAVVTTWQWNSLIQDFQEALFAMGKVDQLTDLELPYKDLSHEHHLRVTAHLAGIDKKNISISFIQRDGYQYRNHALVKSAISNPAFQKYAPLDNDKLAAFMAERADGVDREHGPYSIAGGTAISLRIG